MDADLQDPPDLITSMIDSWYEGFDVVHTVRTKREKESLLKNNCKFILQNSKQAF